MASRSISSLWSRALRKHAGSVVKATLRAGKQVVGRAVETAARQQRPPTGPGDWITGMALGATGARRYYLYRPPGVAATERLPLLVMLHGCGQNAKTFAHSTRMNRVAARERFLVLYVEQDAIAHPRGCWRWFDTRNGHAQAEAAIIVSAIDQVCLLYPADVHRVAVAGLSAGACMASLLAVRYPDRFRAVAMHSGVGPGVATSTATALRAMGGYANQGPALELAPGVALPPLLVVQGLSDNVVVHANATEAAQLWAQAAGAVARPAREWRRGKRYPMRMTNFDHPATGTAVTLCEIESLGHAWSGGSAQQPHGDVRGPDASRLVWRFVSRYLQGPADGVGTRADAGAERAVRVG